MKKRQVYIAIALCFAIISFILLNDYFRATFVSEAGEGGEGEILNTTQDYFTPVVNEEVKEVVRISVFGDNLIHENILNYSNLLAGGSGHRDGYESGFEFAPIYAPLQTAIKEADFSIINQASLVGANDKPEKLSGYPLFNSPSKLADDLISLGFDGVNIANNHMLDMTQKGYERSVSLWKSKNIALLGGYYGVEEANSIEQKIHRIGDFNVAILSYTATTNGLFSDSDSIPYYTLNDSAILRKKLTDQVSACREKADIVLVLMNWGNGAGYEPNQNQIEAAQILCDAGADMIIGSGPKVIQSVQKLTSTDGCQETVCFYSLGNIMCTMEYMENLLGGYVTFDIAREAEKAVIENIKFHPTVIHYDKSYSNISVYPLEDYSMDQYNAHGSNIHKGSGSFSWFEETVDRYIPKEFR